MDEKPQSLPNEDVQLKRIKQLFFGVAFPCLCLWWIFQTLFTASHLGIFSWLSGLVSLVGMYGVVVAVVLWIRAFRQRRQGRTNTLQKRIMLKQWSLQSVVGLIASMTGLTLGSLGKATNNAVFDTLVWLIPALIILLGIFLVALILSIEWRKKEREERQQTNM